MPAPSPWAPTQSRDEVVADAITDWTLLWGSYNGWSFGWGTPWDITSVDGLADMMELKTQDAQLLGDGEVFGQDWEQKRILTVEFSGWAALLEHCWPGEGMLPPDRVMDARCACMRRQDDLPLQINDRWVIMARPRKFVVPQRRAEPVKMTVSWEAQDPALYSALEQSASAGLQVTGEGRPYPRPSGSPGLTFPDQWVWRYQGTRTSGLMMVENEGCRQTYLRVRITGPVQNPILINQVSFERLEFNLNLLAGETLDIDMRRGRVLMNGDATRYYTVTRDSTWWSCGPGRTPVRFLGRGPVTGATATIWWRSAW